ncbi:TatD family hydrolase [Beggiatoa leptomitoformis]|uniref:YchF/TatD family DNA exonuclease n=1 Tax=Beggiatoa leptomitoformis TaxID=288004 RepID=A0A2N9YIR3_9GAMM|nr:TatD family hydrolase [Beggiatoa leptomitoformis]ALG67375.1 YchF/TatD family DNA exonuclease [Beggiatoa leptomitoformis]AUI70418.1 YchF/TatD family DNA exonuclease [Beggiatoa leptomitoformis]
MNPTLPQLIDSHSHFDADEFASDRMAVFTRAQMANVTLQIVPAVCFRWWEQLRNVCQTYTGLYPAYGLHPLYLAEHDPRHLTALPTWLTQESAVAVGECGLDYYVAGLDAEKQAYFFTTQLQIAVDLQLPVIIHARRAVEAVIQHLRRFPRSRGVIHSFAGSEQQARQLLDLGFYLSFGGPITYPNAHKLRKLVQVLPLDGILLETDSPDQPLATHRGERNEPAYLTEVLQTMAILRQQSPAEIAHITTCNTLELFGLKQ